MASFGCGVKLISRYFRNLFNSPFVEKEKPLEIEVVQHLSNIVETVASSVSDVFDDNCPSTEDLLEAGKMNKKLAILLEEVEQIRISYDLWKCDSASKGNDEIAFKCGALYRSIGRMKDDVFVAYLHMSPVKKMDLLNKNKKMSTIFSSLSSLEDEIGEMMAKLSPEGGNRTSAWVNEEKFVNAYYYCNGKILKSNESGKFMKTDFTDQVELKWKNYLDENSLEMYDKMITSNLLSIVTLPNDSFEASNESSFPVEKLSKESMKFSKCSFLTVEDDIFGASSLESKSSDGGSCCTCRHVSEDSLYKQLMNDVFDDVEPNLWKMAAKMAIEEPITSPQYN